MEFKTRQEPHTYELIKTYLYYRGILPDWCFQIRDCKTILFQKNSITYEFKNICENLNKLKTTEIMLILKSQIYDNWCLIEPGQIILKQQTAPNTSKEIMQIQLNNPVFTHAISETNKLENFIKTIRNLKKMQNKELYLIIKGTKTDKILIKIFPSYFIIQKDKKTSFFERNILTKKINEINFKEFSQKKISSLPILNISITYMISEELNLIFDKTDNFIFKFPTPEFSFKKDSDSKKKLIFMKNENSFIKVTNEKSKIFESSTIVKIETNEQIPGVEELTALNILNEKLKFESEKRNKI
ncbi:hypothetical protein CDIK_2197 [Cucumispora dikerogammari]|nr:hypothetical protein CDIK_2197 [Cucumispora dikerogammari]